LKHQILILINYRNPDEPGIFTPGFVVNCDNAPHLMSTLKSCAEYGHEVEVKTLDDDEPWPTLMERLEN
jgi:hypothetical protein